MWWRELCGVIALLYFSIHFLWAILTLCLSSGHCEVFVGFCEILSSASDYVGLYLIDGHIREGFYKRMYIALCLFQVVQNFKLLFAVIGKSRRLLESWLVYNGLMLALALVAHLRHYYAKEFDLSIEPEDEYWFWNGFFPRFLTFWVVNAFVIFVVNELWHYLTEEMKAGGRSADIGYCRCFSNQSWMTFVGCANRILHFIVFFVTIIMVGVQWTYMKSFAAEEFRLWVMLILSALAVMNSFPWRGCTPNDPEVLQLWMKREVFVCTVTYLVHISEAFEDTDFDLLVLKFVVNEFIMVYAIFAAKDLLISPES